MQKEAFDTLEILEGSWWDLGRQAAVRAVLAGRRFNRVLDYGAGFGSQLSFLRERGREVYAFEPEPSLKGTLEARGYDFIFDAPQDALARSYDLIALLDVLEHIEDDTAIARALLGSLAPGGTMVVTVPAYQWLWSDHDVKNKHFRRYTKNSLRNVLQNVGCTVEYLGHWNMAPLMPLSLMRLLGGTGTSGAKVPRPINALVASWLYLEAFVMRFVPLPFGVSLIARIAKSR